MAIINGTSLTLADTFVDTGDTLLAAPYTGTAAVVNGTTFLYVPSSIEDGVQVFRVDTGGVLTPVANVADTSGLALDFAVETITFTSGGNSFLAATGLSDDGVTVFALSDTAPYLTFADRVFDTEDVNYELDGAWEMAVFEGTSETFLYVSGNVDDGISVFSVDGSGGLTSVQNIADDIALEFNRPHLSDTFQVGSFAYLIASGEIDDGFTLFGINPNTGTLANVATVSDSDTLNGAYSASGTDIEGRPFLYIPADDGDTIAVYSVFGGTATLEQVLRGPGSLDRASTSEILELGDRKYLIVGAFNADQIHLYEIETNGATGRLGQLTLVDSVFDNVGQGLVEFPFVGDTFEVDGQTFFMVTSLDDDAVNVYEVGGGDDVLEGTNLSDTITGGGGDDILYGKGGGDIIDGGPGDDVIFGGSGGDAVALSTGEDVLFGGSGDDSLDAAAFDDVTGGVTIDFLRDTVRLPDGSIQSIDSFEIAFGTVRADLLIGDDKANVLFGQAGGDTLRGRDGNDELFGGDGEDRIFGAGGDDDIDAGNGQDLINGGSGDDVIDGGGADDRVFAGSGDDVIDGGAGSDRIKGNEGNDTINGGAGSDFLEGQSGDDAISGGDGNDIILGGSGRDGIFGGDGADTLTGGSAIDTFLFLPVALGGGGNDIITDFNDGVDVIDVRFYATDAASLLPLASQNGADTVISFTDGQSVRLLDFARADLDASDFIF